MSKQQNNAINTITTFETKILPLDNLYVYSYEKYPDGYQRPLDEERVLEISESFMPIKVNDILVAFRDGRHWIVDGQHTVSILKNVGYKATTCKVFKSSGIKQEAQLYDDYNTNKGKVKISGFQRFQSRLAYNHPTCIKIDEIYKKWGVKLVDGNDSTYYHAAISGVLNDLIKSDKQLNNFELAVNFVMTNWPMDNDIWKSDFFKGLFPLMPLIHMYDKNKVKKILSKYSVDDILKKAKPLAIKANQHRAMPKVKEVLEKLLIDAIIPPK